MTAELGRQPWLIHGLFRTSDGYSKVVSNGDTVFTLIGFVGLYFVLGLLFLFLIGREISHGPDKEIVVRSRIARRPDEKVVAGNGEPSVHTTAGEAVAVHGEGGSI
jgi:cytochrome bd-type quinol oxidase subunit 1